MGIAKELKERLEQEKAARAAVPWWMGLTTIQRAIAIRDEIEGQVTSFQAQHQAFEQAFARLGFAGHGNSRGRPPRTN